MFVTFWFRRSEQSGCWWEKDMKLEPKKRFFGKVWGLMDEMSEWNLFVVPQWWNCSVPERQPAMAEGGAVQSCVRCAQWGEERRECSPPVEPPPHAADHHLRCTILQPDCGGWGGPVAHATSCWSTSGELKDHDSHSASGSPQGPQEPRAAGRG